MINPFKVRRATPDDAAALVNFTLDLYAEEGLQTVSPGKVTALVQRAVNRDGAIAGIIEGETGIEASVGLAIEQYDYSDEKHLKMKWLGVRPAFRKGDRAANLMRFAQWCHEEINKASEHPMPLYLDLLTREALAGKMHLYLRLVPQVGATFACGGVPPDQFNQGHVGDDRHETHRVRKRSKTADGRRVPPIRTERAAIGA